MRITGQHTGVSSSRNIDLSALTNRGNTIKQNSNRNLDQFNTHHAVRVNISNDAQRRFTAMQQNGGLPLDARLLNLDKTVQKLEEHNTVERGISLSADECFAAPWARVGTQYTWESTGCPHVDSLGSFWASVVPFSHASSGDEDAVSPVAAQQKNIMDVIASLDSRVSELGLHLLSSIITSNEPTIGAGFHEFGIGNMWWGIDMNNQAQNLAAMANKYSDMRDALKAEFEGADLEEQLSKLSDAFDLIANIYADAVTAWTSQRLFNEELSMSVHKHDRIQNGQKVENNFDIEEIGRLRDRITNSVNEAANHFAQQFRQFVVENGTINSERQLELLATFLQNSNRGDGQLTFDQFTGVINIISAQSEDVVRTQTMFDEVRQLLDE